MRIINIIFIHLFMQSKHNYQLLVNHACVHTIMYWHVQTQNSRLRKCSPRPVFVKPEKDKDFPYK